MGYAVSWSKGDQKTFREFCNATITKVLNTSGANYKINLNRESKIFYESFTLSDHQEA